jgi:hypothetical protein
MPQMTSKFDKAHWLAFLLPAALLGGAYGSQYIGGLFPCEMCWWQRYPHFAAVAIAAIAFGVGNLAFEPCEQRWPGHADGVIWHGVIDPVRQFIALLLGSLSPCSPLRGFGGEGLDLRFL